MSADYDRPDRIWVALIIMLVIVALAALLVGCGSASPTAPTPDPPKAPICRDLFHPEIRETVPRIINGQLVFVVIITPAWTETICE